MIPILSDVETPDFFELELPAGPGGPGAPAPSNYPQPASNDLWAAGERITWGAGLVLVIPTTALYSDSICMRAIPILSEPAPLLLYLLW